jgi:biopolymer transport protein ExbD
MRIQGAKKVHYDSGPNMTPLVDVVMVILIFLMLAGSFVTAEHFLVSNLPVVQSGAGGEQLPPGFIPDEPIDIRVDTNPATGAFVATAGQIRTSDAQTLTQQLRAMRVKLNATGQERRQAAGEDRTGEEREVPGPRRGVRSGAERGL